MLIGRLQQILWCACMTFLKRWKIRLLIFFAVVGPGFITANVDNDAGGIWTYSAAGAQFGHMLLWTMIPITVALIVVQEIAARMGAVTGKGLSDLIREEFGFRITFFMMIGLIIVNFGNVVTEFAGIAGSLELFGLNKYYTVPICAVIVWLIVVKGQYKTVEKVFLAASFFYLTYIVAGFLAKPAWLEALEATIVPPHKEMFLRQDYLYMVIGVVGTTIAPWMQFYLQASIVEKGVTRRQYKASRLDVVDRLRLHRHCGLVHHRGLRVHALCPRLPQHQRRQGCGPGAASRWRETTLTFCLPWDCSTLRCSQRRFCRYPPPTRFAKAWDSSPALGKRFSEAPVFYWLYTILIVAGAGVILLPNIPLVKISILSQVVNGVVLPFVLVFMLLLVNNKEIMGEYVNSRSTMSSPGLTTVIMVGLTLAWFWTFGALAGTGVEQVLRSFCRT